MTYDTHFLSRLERASDKEVRFAMSLYYDSEFTRDIIKLIQLPDQAERVAIALSEGDRTSHVILARNGSFVTCLGPGMQFGELPVVTQHQFKGLIKQKEKHQQRESEIKAFLDKSSLEEVLNESVYRAGRNLTREQFKKWELFQPLLFPTLLKIHSLAIEKALELTVRLQSTGRKDKIRSKKERQDLRKLWEAKWTLGHIAMILFSDTTFMNKMPTDWLDVPRFTSLCLLEKMIPMSLMGLWFAARMGKHLFPAAKNMLIKPKDPWDYIDATLILISIALRHRRYRGEVTKLLNRKITGLPKGSIKFCTYVNKAFSSCFNEQKKNQEVLEKVALLYFKEDNSSDSGKIINKVPMDIKIAGVAHNEIHFLEDNDTNGLIQMMLLLPWMIQREASEFYIPEQYKTMFYPYEMEHAMNIVKGGLFEDVSPGVLKDRKKPNRNQPCHCGSKKKYKRCCFKKDRAQSQ